MRSLLMIVVVAAAAAGCRARKPAEPPPPPAASPPAPSPPAVAAPVAPPVPVSPAPARTELDRSPGFAVEQTKPKLVAGAYVWPCPLNGLEDATISIAKNRRLSLSNASRNLAALKLDDDFYAADTEVTCQKGFVTIHREKNGRYREAGFAWDHRRLAKTARSEGLIPPVRGP